jgi:hypothetical protein
MDAVCKRLCVFLCPFLICLSVAVSNPALAQLSQDVSLNIFLAPDTPQAQFARAEIVKAINATVSATPRKDRRIVLAVLGKEPILTEMKALGLQPETGLKEEGFSIRGKGRTIYVIGKDNAGVMYGGLELAEVIRTAGIDSVTDQVQNPYMKMRGTKFNCPLDVRTPSYTDVSDAAQKNIPEMWSLDFWKEYIDSLAKYRYNYISLWSLHPFPSLVKVPEYPDIALDDVRRSTVNWQEHYNLNGHGFDAPEIVKNYEVIKQISMADKIKFWRQVMRYGKERNVDFYFVTWNIFINGTEGKYGITDKIDNPITRDYFRQSVKQMFLTYPDLAGIGLTTGENMYGHSTEEKEDWAFATYAQGVLDAAKAQPGRKMTFIHRQHQTGALKIAEKFQPLVDHEDINFIFSFKYAKAHVYSSINQVYHQGFVKDIQKDRALKTIWTLRNDDIFHFRWGAPDYVRAFIKNIPYDVSEGYYYGSDQYIWGREFLNRYPSEPRQIEIVKHGYHWMLWGRLGYNPDVSNDRFQALLQARFPEVDAGKLFAAWQHASMIYPLTTGFHWGSLDFQWYIESGQSRPDPARTPSGYHDVNRFISLSPHKGTGYASISDYVESVVHGKASKGKSPLAVAQEIAEHANRALDWAMTTSVTDKELRLVKDDIRAMSYLGLYYAHKINAATHLALFRAELQKSHRDKTLHHLNESAGHWRRYASMALSNNNNPLWTNRVGTVDWRETYRLILYDITANGGDLDVPPMAPTPGGIILEAEDADYTLTTFKSSITASTGRGYLESSHGDAHQSVTWQFDAPTAGEYVLEFRYSLRRQNPYESPVVVNGKVADNIVFWMTGSSRSWAWDRVKVSLDQGVNTIDVSPEGFVLLDHLNVLK